MERNPPKPMTPFDCITTPDWLYMFKLMNPYTPANIQHSLALFIRFQEMQYTMRHFHGFSKSKPSNSILNDIRPYMDPSAQEMMEQMESLMNMMEMMQSFQENTPDNSSDPSGFNPMDILSDMFNMKGDFEHERMDESPGNEKSR